MSFVFFIINYTTSYTVTIYIPKDVCTCTRRVYAIKKQTQNHSILLFL